MPAPTDYLSPLLQAAQVNPTQSIGQSLGQGMALGDNIVAGQRQGIMFQQAQQDRTALIEKAKADAIKAAQQQVKVTEDMDKYFGNGVTSQGIAGFVAANPALAEPYLKLMKEVSPQEAEQRQRQMLRVYSSLQAGEDIVAIDGLQRDALALTNQGREEEARALYDLANTIERNPEKALTKAGTYLAGTMGPQNFLSVVGGLDDRPAVKREALAKAKQAEVEADNKLSEILKGMERTDAEITKWKADAKNDAGLLGLGWAEYALKKAAAEKAAIAGVIDLDTDVKKAIEGDANMATKAESMVELSDGYLDVIGRGEKNPDGSEKTPMGNKGAIGGVVGAGRDLATGVLGIQSDASDQNQRYIEIRNGLIKANRGPGEGPMTDPDFKIAAAAYPGENASAEQKAMTITRLKGQAKAAAELLSAAARFRALNGGPGQTRAPMNVNGLDVPAGTDLATFNNMWRAQRPKAPAAGPAKAPAEMTPGQQAKAKEMAKAGKSKAEIKAALGLTGG